MSTTYIWYPCRVHSNHTQHGVLQYTFTIHLNAVPYDGQCNAYWLRDSHYDRIGADWPNVAGPPLGFVMMRVVEDERDPSDCVIAVPGINAELGASSAAMRGHRQLTATERSELPITGWETDLEQVQQLRRGWPETERRLNAILTPATPSPSGQWVWWPCRIGWGRSPTSRRYRVHHNRELLASGVAEIEQLRDSTNRYRELDTGMSPDGEDLGPVDTVARIAACVAAHSATHVMVTFDNANVVLVPTDVARGRRPLTPEDLEALNLPIPASAERTSPQPPYWLWYPCLYSQCNVDFERRYQVLDRGRFGSMRLHGQVPMAAILDGSGQPLTHFIELSPEERQGYVAMRVDEYEFNSARVVFPGAGIYSLAQELLGAGFRPLTEEEVEALPESSYSYAASGPPARSIDDVIADFYRPELGELHQPTQLLSRKQVRRRLDLGVAVLDPTLPETPLTADWLLDHATVILPQHQGDWVICKFGDAGLWLELHISKGQITCTNLLAACNMFTLPRSPRTREQLFALLQGLDLPVPEE